MDSDDPLNTFAAECAELLETMEAALLRSEQAPDDPETINAIFRAAHTIKGSAGLFGFDRLVDFTHAAESVLDRVRGGEVRIDSPMVALLLAVCDHLGVLVRQAVADQAPDRDTQLVHESLLGRLRAHLDAAVAPPPGQRAAAAAGTEGHSGNWHISARFGTSVFRGGFDPLAFVRYLATFGDIADIAMHADVPALSNLDPESCHLGFEIDFKTNADKATIEAVFEFVRDDARIVVDPRRGGAAPAHDGAPAAAAERKQGDGGLIRVNAEKLGEHIRLVGELIIASAGIGLIARQSDQAALGEAAARLARLVEEVRDSALSLRMVQIGATFGKFQRVVRDVSAELGKDIRLEISGAETELDKTVVERIGDPLTHLVRNSMDHGIEPADVRLAAGKPAHGTLKLDAYHDSGSIVIEVSDDGGGLDRRRILAKAIERGLVAPDHEPADRDIDNLIFEPGFSTAEHVSDLSGRGVGMDVVRRNIAALRGGVEIDSRAGAGTTMRIRLPLTLAIIDGFLVAIGASHFIVPLEAVIECVELPADASRTACGSDYLNLRGEPLPYIRLRKLFGIPPAPAAPLRENVVVVQRAGRRAGLVVDGLLGEFQTVIRPLGAVFSGIPGLSGFTILGSGRVALILDVPGLVQRAMQSVPAAPLRLAEAA